MRTVALLVLALLVAGACRPAAATPGGSALRGASPLGTAAPASATRVVRVAAAADLRYAMDELVAAWNAGHPAQAAAVTYGSSGTFFSQISEGAPFDVFFSADAEYPRRLEQAGRADAGATKLYAVGRLVTWAPDGSPIDVAARGLEALTDDRVTHVAIANPEHAPYGRAAVAALEAAGVYAAVEPKLVLGENVSQAAQFVESGNADAGVIALSLALAPAMSGKGRYAIVPIDSYPRLDQAAVVLRDAQDVAAAQAFLAHALGPDGRAVLDRYGFLLPGS